MKRSNVCIKLIANLLFERKLKLKMQQLTINTYIYSEEINNLFNDSTLVEFNIGW